MTRDDDTAPDRGESPRETTDSDGRADASSARFDRLSASDVRGLLDRVALAALVLLALIAGWNLYGHLGTAIRTWVDPAYQPIALAGLNLAVLLIAIAGVVHQIRRIRADEESSVATPE